MYGKLVNSYGLKAQTRHWPRIAIETFIHIIHIAAYYPTLVAELQSSRTTVLTFKPASRVRGILSHEPDNNLQPLRTTEPSLL